MGNSNSQQLHAHAHHAQLAHAHVHAQQWTNSCPRINAPENKVLPERIPGQRLRVTDNGAILHNGGTISGRRGQSPGRYSDEEQPSERYRPRSSSHHRLHAAPRQPSLHKLNAKRFGSEPDLRNPQPPQKDSPAKLRISRTRKKYKAPPPPPEGDSVAPYSSSPDSYQWENLDPPARRLRLFKTREETKKVPRHPPTPRSISPSPRPRERSRGRDQERIVLKVRDQDRNIVHVRDHRETVPNGRMPSENGRVMPDHGRPLPEHGFRVKVEKRMLEAPSIPRVNGLRHAPPPPRSLSTPEFQAELRSAAQRLRQPPRDRRLGVRDNRLDVDGRDESRNHRTENRIVTSDSRELRSDVLDSRPDIVDSKHGNRELRSKSREQRSESRELRAEIRHVRAEIREFRESKPDERVYGPEGRDYREPWQGEERGVPVGEAAVETRPRGDGSGRESSPEPLNSRRRHDVRKPPDTHWDILPPVNGIDRDVPTKTFYFGMEAGERDAVERFAASLHLPPTRPESGGSESSDTDGEGVALQLRPMLPKKQLEIPRFSPTAAWRLLSAVEAPSAGSAGEEPPVLLEERIQRLSRPVAPPAPPPGPRSSHDKSGDSGISGDASPGALDDVDPPLRGVAMAAAWTPQQDLGEESSSDGGDETVHKDDHDTQPKFSPRAQVFSLSLPRDERLCLALYSESNKTKRDVHTSFNSLKKLKRSVSGAFTALNTPTKLKDDHLLDENWLLSRSLANSLTGAVKKEASHSSNVSTPDHEVSQRTSFSYLASGGHVMYLPEYKSRPQDHAIGDRPYSGDLHVTNLISKSCENISASEMRQLDRTPSPDAMLTAARNEGFTTVDGEPHRELLSTGKRGKGKRFTFQSTVRQIERRRISERLSREAESKERRRLGELEAMRRVEEEFQRKRAPEKANIRQQLRLFSLDEQLFSSLPTGWRAEPDGATSSSPASSPDPYHPPSTQILSEFREPRRDYRDYRPHRNSVDPSPESLPEKRSTVHPSAVFDMPKNTPVYIAQPCRVVDSNDAGAVSTPTSCDNYRRDFAHGALRSLASSDSELSQPNTRPTSRQRSRTPSPAAEQRAKSVEPATPEETPVQQTAVPVVTAPRISLTSVQPFVLNGKGYRPIAFTLGTSAAGPVAQPVK